MTTNYGPEQHHRHSIRLPHHDYAGPGAYHVTVCTQDRECVFGEIMDGEMVLNAPGIMIECVCIELPDRYPGVELDAFVIMPNHVHLVIVLVGATPRGCPGPAGQAQGPAPTPGTSLPDVVHRFKSLTTAKYRQGARDNAWLPFRHRLWQRNYYEHVIRNDAELDDIRRYIAENPLRWDDDPENPETTIDGLAAEENPTPSIRFAES